MLLNCAECCIIKHYDKNDKENDEKKTLQRVEKNNEEIDNIYVILYDRDEFIRDCPRLSRRQVALVGLCLVGIEFRYKRDIP